MYWRKDIRFNLIPNIARLNAERSTKFKYLFVFVLSLLSASLHMIGEGLNSELGAVLIFSGSAPIIMSMLISFSYGIFSYGITIFLLFMIQQELSTLSFMTGFIALTLSLGFFLFKKRWEIIIMSSFAMLPVTSIICFGLNKPILSILSEFNLGNLAFLFIALFVCNWLWVEYIVYIVPVVFKKVADFKVKSTVNN